MTNPSPPSSPFEQVVDRWLELKTPASTFVRMPALVEKERREFEKDLEFLLDTGLLKLVEERPELVPATGGNPSSRIDAGEQPRGEPSQKAIDTAVSTCLDGNGDMADALRAAYRIDNPSREGPRLTREEIDKLREIVCRYEDAINSTQYVGSEGLHDIFKARESIWRAFPETLDAALAAKRTASDTEGEDG